MSDNEGRPDNERRRRELARKALHFLIALSPAAAALNRVFALVLLGAGVAAYTVMETLRRRGLRIPLVSDLTVFASRRRDRGRFVLGPVTLGAGAFLSLLLFPPRTAAIAVCALAFGDGTASLAGKFIGRIRPSFLFGKSLEGSAACFAGTLLSAYIVTLCYGEGSWSAALIAAGTAVLAELPPIRDWDNVIIPLAAGLAVEFIPRLAAFY
ncbi:MAG: SEC59/DGK1/VTE5 family protein [Treponema sp.]|jgi:dolichol kinase|nr:SEC59/DGK1/VTE5 family protein [Treponema sp.]